MSDRQCPPAVGHPNTALPGGSQVFIGASGCPPALGTAAPGRQGLPLAPAPPGQHRSPGARSARANFTREAIFFFFPC